MKTEIIAPPEWRAPLAGFIAYLEAGNRPAKTQYLRSYQLRRFAVETGLSPRAATHDDLITYLGSHGWGNSTKHSVRAAFRSFWFWAFNIAKIVDEDAAALLPSMRPNQGSPRPAPALVAVGAMREAEDPRVRLMIEIAASAGLRCCEICRVHTGDLFEDLEGWSLRIFGKGGRRRSVPIGRELAAKLLELEPGWVFPGQDDGHLSAAYVSKLISRALPEGITAHMLRHLYAAQSYVATGRDIRAVQELLGHSNVATTQVYTQVPAGAKRAAADGASAMFYNRVAA